MGFSHYRIASSVIAPYTSHDDQPNLTDMGQERQSGHPVLQLDAHSDRFIFEHAPRVAMRRYLHPPAAFPVHPATLIRLPKILGAKEEEPLPLDERFQEPNSCTKGNNRV
ncbi:hypothetical protein CH063_02276 [Colletotrichum higginsianum]|uniref:Uncharacterized protein n=1 Tax=Colletotrichum higginsianum (strain IMI 349063) TaxID=759273 RepID=H1VIQ0_COLHI|nr:hypothetical protein CH063_02276 [Colletotrichum higginsianum]